MDRCSESRILRDRGGGVVGGDDLSGLFLFFVFMNTEQ